MGQPYEVSRNYVGHMSRLPYSTYPFILGERGIFSQPTLLNFFTHLTSRFIPTRSPFLLTFFRCGFPNSSFFKENKICYFLKGYYWIQFNLICRNMDQNQHLIIVYQNHVPLKSLLFQWVTTIFKPLLKSSQFGVGIILCYLSSYFFSFHNMLFVKLVTVDERQSRWLELTAKCDR